MFSIVSTKSVYDLRDQIKKKDARIEELSQIIEDLRETNMALETAKYQRSNYSVKDLKEGMVVFTNGSKRRICVVGKSWVLNCYAEEGALNISVPDAFKTKFKSQPVSKAKLYNYMKSCNYVIGYED